MNKLSMRQVVCCHSNKVFVSLLAYLAITFLPESAFAQTEQISLLFPVCRQNRCGYIDQKGSLAISLRFDDVGLFAEGLAPVRFGMNWGYINERGQLIISLQFSNAGEFSEGKAPVQKDSKWGYVNRTGGIVIEPKFDDAKAFKFGYAKVRNGVNWSYIDSEGRQSSINFWGNPDFTEGLTPASDGNKVGYVDSHLNWSIRPQFKDGGHLSEGLIPVQVGEKWGYIDKRGSFVIPPRFARAKSFSEGLAAVGIDLNCEGYIDKTGKFIIAPVFRDAEGFSGGLALVIYHGRFIKNPKEHTGLEFVGARLGYINNSGKLIIKLEKRTDYAGPFIQGVAYVRQKDGRFGYINKRGEYLWQPTK